MLLCSPWLARICVMYMLILSWICAVCSAIMIRASDDLDMQPHNNNDTHPGLICSPFGVCEPCPEDALGEPFCKPFGNRRLMHCTDAAGDPGAPTSTEGLTTQGRPTPNHSQSQHPQGETIAWESCGRIVGQERADFYEFVACNILFAVVALFILFTRSKRLHAMQARHLAARIGLIRNNGTGGRR